MAPISFTPTQPSSKNVESASQMHIHLNPMIPGPKNHDVESQTFLNCYSFVL
jgi:hypothetical protein